MKKIDKNIKLKFKPCLGIYEFIINNQSLWQLEYKDNEIKNLLIFKDEYSILTTNLTTMFGINKELVFYIYKYNFSMN